MKIYLATSWRNHYHPGVLHALRRIGHEVYNFRQPSKDDSGFSWSEIDPNWKNWSASQYREALKSPIAVRGYANDKGALDWCDACVYLLPCGRSASWELGYAMGKGKPSYVVMLENDTPDLMFMEATIITNMTELFDIFGEPLDL